MMDEREKANKESEARNAILRTDFAKQIPGHPVVDMDCVWAYDLDVTPEAVDACIMLLHDRFEYWDIGFRDIYYYCKIPKQFKGSPMVRPIKVRKDIYQTGSLCTAIIKAVLEAEILA